MRRKSIGATSQAFHEGIFGILDAARLPGCRAQGLVGQVPRGLRPQRLKCCCEDGNKKLKTWLAGSQPVRVAGSRPQGPVGQVSRGLGARAPRAWGPGLGLFAHKNDPNLSNYDFSQTSWWEPGEGVGVG